MILDTRSAEDYALGHIPGAVNVSPKTLFNPENLAKLPAEADRFLTATRPDRQPGDRPRCASWATMPTTCSSAAVMGDRPWRVGRRVGCRARASTSRWCSVPSDRRPPHDDRCRDDYGCAGPCCAAHHRRADHAGPGPGWPGPGEPGRCAAATLKTLESPAGHGRDFTCWGVTRGPASRHAHVPHAFSGESHHVPHNPEIGGDACVAGPADRRCGRAGRLWWPAGRPAAGRRTGADRCPTHQRSRPSLRRRPSRRPRRPSRPPPWRPPTHLRRSRPPRPPKRRPRNRSSVTPPTA